MDTGGRVGTIVLVGLALGLVALQFVQSRPVALPPEWGDDLAQAIAAAGESDRPVLAAFHSPGCPPCKAMERSVLNRPDVLDAMQGVIPVRINAMDDATAARKYEVVGTPTYLLLDPRGRKIAGMVGYVEPTDFIRFIKSNIDSQG